MNRISGRVEKSESFAAERDALAKVTRSRLFRRAGNLSRILVYLCERYFEGCAESPKEYNIAIEALGRPPNFDPQADSIVRVDLYLLRKRLEEYYSGEGINDALRIALPGGQYTPEFVPNKCSSSAGDRRWRDQPSVVDETTPEETSRQPSFASVLGGFAKRLPLAYINESLLLASVCLVIGLLVGAGAMFLLLHRSVPIRSTQFLPVAMAAARSDRPGKFVASGLPDSDAQGIRIRCGAKDSYVDDAGYRWSGDRWYVGGTPFQRSATNIARTANPPLYETGREGAFHYSIPVSAGNYEVHLLFAETKPGIQDGMRQVSYTISSGQTDTIDVAADAAGAQTATMKVYPNIRPEADGAIHLNFWSENAFVNAIEILPQRGSRPNPVRISALHTQYTDAKGGHWLPDRFFLGGRNIDHEFSFATHDLPLVSRERYGNFNYSIPVARGFTYSLTLVMTERYWGSRNSGLGGIGSRVFNVYCNDTLLLSNFDLLKTDSSSNPVMVRFRGLRPDPMGKLNLRFVPVTNYAVVNAIEVDPE